VKKFTRQGGARAAKSPFVSWEGDFMRLARLLVTLSIAFCAASAARADTAGQVMFAYGETLALREGRIVRLITGAPVESGDQIHTGVESYLQIRFTDWSVISLRPRTDFVIEDYAYEQRRGGRERAFFTLLSGGLRSLTGMIGHRDRGHYRVRTKTSAIGVRGTHYSVLICKEDCRLADGSLGEDGLYGGVIDGRIAVSPYGGGTLEREFGAGEYFRLENEHSIPVPLFVPPSFFWDKLEPQARSGSRTFAGIPWKPAPGPGSSDRGSPVAGDVTDIAGSLLRADGSLMLSPITAPLLSPVGTRVGSTVGSVTAPLTPLVGSTVSALMTSPLVAPVTSIVGSATGPLLTPVLTAVAPVTGATAPLVNTIVAPLAPVIAPVIAPVAPVIAPLVPVAPVIAPPTNTVSLPSVPSLPVTGGLPSLLPKK